MPKPESLADEYRGPWSEAEVSAFLLDTRVPLRLACNATSGHPLLASLWFHPDQGALWCATQASASVVSILDRDPRCAFEVSVESPPYVGVRGPARASLHPERGEAMLRTLIERFLGDSDPELASKLLANAEDEVAVRIQPLKIVSWDFRDRMREPS